MWRGDSRGHAAKARTEDHATDGSSESDAPAESAETGQALVGGAAARFGETQRGAGNAVETSKTQGGDAHLIAAPGACSP